MSIAGYSIFLLNIALFTFLKFFQKMMELFKLKYKELSVWLVAFFWIVIPVPYNVVLTIFPATLAKTGPQIKNYYRATLIYFGVLMLLTTSFIAIFLNVYLFRIEFEKKIKYIAGLLKVDLSVYYVHSKVETLRNWLEYYFIHKQERTHKKIAEGHPIFWWEYSGKDSVNFKKQLISRPAFDDLSKKIKKNHNVLAKFLHKKFKKKEPKWYERLICCKKGPEKKKDKLINGRDFEGQIHSESDDNLKNMLDQIKEEELNEDFIDTVGRQDDRREDLFRKVTLAIDKKTNIMPMWEFKERLD